MQAFGLARVGKDVEVRQTSAGPVANVSLAFNYGRKDGEGRRPTQWVDATLWGDRAEALAEYLTKGSLVAVILDEVHIEEFEGRNGPGHKLVGNVLQIDLAGGSPQQRPPAPAPTAGQRRTPAPAPASRGGATGTGFDDMDDDIPFASSFASDEPQRTSARRMRRYG